jgi:hypothetical protein
MTAKTTDKPSNRATALALGVLLLFTAASFTVSVRCRSPWFGQTGATMSGAMTAGTAGMAKQWYLEGPGHLGFLMYWEPDSIENPTLESRTPYISYPPGAVIPIYLLAKLSGAAPTPSMVMAYNLANHALIAIVLAILSFLLLLRMGYHPVVACVLSAITSNLYLWLPSPFWEHQMGFFSDQAVILPWVLFVLLETLKGRNNRLTHGAAHRCDGNLSYHRTLALLQATVAVWGMYTDWLFALVALCVYAARLLRREIPLRPRPLLVQSVTFWAPIAAALGVFLLQLYRAGALAAIAERFLYRTGVSDNAARLLRTAPEIWSWRSLYSFSLDTRFWTAFFPQAYGPWGKTLLLCSVLMLVVLAACRFARSRRPDSRPDGSGDALTVLFLLLGPCLLHYHLLKAHSSFFLHSFSVLKFAVPMAVLPLALGPAALVNTLRRRPPRLPVQVGLAAILATAATVYAVSLSSQRQAYYAQHQPKDYERVGAFIAAHTEYRDVVFSNNVSIPRNFIVYSMKQVHRMDTVEDIQQVLHGVSGDYVLNLFSNGPEQYEPSSGLGALVPLTFDETHEGDLHLRKIRRADFERLYPKPVTENRP